MRPACANWKIWIGPEVEGDQSLGKKTLFIRELNTTAVEFDTNSSALVPRMTRNGEITRVWFCKEFTNWELLRVIAKHFQEVCVEVTPKTFGNMPHDIQTSFVMYMKVPFNLKDGDFVCVGPPFQDEAFRVGTGRKVSPDQYSNDIKIQ